MVDVGNPHSDNLSQCRQRDHRMLRRIVVTLFEDVAERSTRDSMGNGSIHRPQEALDLPLEPRRATRGSNPIDVQGEAHLFQARRVELETAVHHEVMHYTISRPFVHDAWVVLLEIDLRKKAVFQTSYDRLIARRIKPDIYAQNAPCVAIDAGRDRWPSQRQTSLVVYNHEVEQCVVYFRPFERCLRDGVTLDTAEFFDCGIVSVA